MVFEYIDEDEEFLSKVVTNKDLWLKLFERMNISMSSNKASDGQTSDSSCKTGLGKIFIIINLLAISVDRVMTSRLFVSFSKGIFYAKFDSFLILLQRLVRETRDKTEAQQMYAKQV